MNSRYFAANQQYEFNNKFNFNIEFIFYQHEKLKIIRDMHLQY